MSHATIAFSQAIETASQTIAPVWPLQRSIAVNPWWQQRHQPIAHASAELHNLHQIKLLMPASYYAQQWRENKISVKQLEQAFCWQTGAEELDADHYQQLLDYTQTEPTETLPHWRPLTDIYDASHNRRDVLSWHDEMVQQISQFCAMWCQYPERFQGQTGQLPLYQAWLSTVQRDRGLEIVMGERYLRRFFAELPQQQDDFHATLLRMLPVQADVYPAYCQVLLLDLNGWAAAFAQRRWQRDLQQQEAQGADELQQLLMIRLAWEWVLWQFLQGQNDAESQAVLDGFQAQFSQTEEWLSAHQHAQEFGWIWQRALELSYQQPLLEQLREAPAHAPSSAPVLQAAFCIDVRSEPMRRALEAQHQDIQTIGYAGFFGLPIAFQHDQAEARPQLPGLLAPQLLAKQQPLTARQTELWRDVSWHRAHDSPAGAFGWVEMSGLAKAWKMLTKHLQPKAQARVGDQLIHAGDWQLFDGDNALDAEALAPMLAGILQGMSLTEQFAETVLLIGHGSCTQNNPHAASLDCGACGGQTGEVNVRVLAQLLNTPQIRELLRQQQLDIPTTTTFYAAMHNTTSDTLRVVSEHALDAPWLSWLQAAGEQAQLEHVQRLPAANNAKQLLQRAGDWAQVRPEWGLVRNAATIFAPRHLSRELDLQGRVFLHDYRSDFDTDGSILTQLMTAPMVVTQWINMQYYASMVDPKHFGSGNKMLHNVVADGIGIFEGNAGDLRIGLPLQSLHDGHDWFHQPLRLSVIIAAPTAQIDAIIASQPVVKDLVENGWLHLFQWQPETQQFQLWQQGQWQPWH